LQPTEEKQSKVRPGARLKYENKSITARPKNCRRKPHQTRISERNRS
jgi:hypothetical protein